jgi:Fic family protein
VRSFEHLGRHLALSPSQSVNALARIDEGRGRQEVFRGQHPMVLDTLRQVAMVQSVGASNAIEDIHVPPGRLRELALDKVTPDDRSESEIAGYRRVLAEIHDNGENIPFTANVVLQLHGWLFSFLPDRAGQWKAGENEVIERHPDGAKVVRFRPVSSGDTPRYMKGLHEQFDRAWAAGTYHSLLLIATYVFDFLMIHPFQDGNGRMSRLVTSLLLNHRDYQVGRYISWEKQINDTRDVYYDALQRSTAGWHDGEHDLKPWLSYFLGVLVASYNAFEERAKLGTGPGTRKAIVEHFVRTNLSDRFTVRDIRDLIPNTSDVQIGRILRDLKARGIIDRRGGGQGTYWVRRTLSRPVENCPICAGRILTPLVGSR